MSFFSRSSSPSSQQLKAPAPGQLGARVAGAMVCWTNRPQLRRGQGTPCLGGVGRHGHRACLDGDRPLQLLRHHSFILGLLWDVGVVYLTGVQAVQPLLHRDIRDVLSAATTPKHGGCSPSGLHGRQRTAPAPSSCGTSSNTRCWPRTATSLASSSWFIVARRSAWGWLAPCSTA